MLTRHSIKTDNANVADKVFLRQRATEHLDELRVLDLYAGENMLWGNFDCARYYGVEIIKGKGRNLHADCVRMASSLDLSGFNVIDCDSYGVPFDVMVNLLDNPTLRAGTVIVFTAISNKMSGISKRCREMFGMDKMTGARTLVNGMALELFYALLAKRGVNDVYYYSIKSSYVKNYGYFVIT